MAACAAAHLTGQEQEQSGLAYSPACVSQPSQAQHNSASSDDRLKPEIARWLKKQFNEVNMTFG